MPHRKGKESMLKRLKKERRGEEKDEWKEMGKEGRGACSDGRYPWEGHHRMTGTVALPAARANTLLSHTAHKTKTLWTFQ